MRPDAQTRARVIPLLLGLVMVAGAGTGWSVLRHQESDADVELAAALVVLNASLEDAPELTGIRADGVAHRLRAAGVRRDGSAPGLALSRAEAIVALQRGDVAEAHHVCEGALGHAPDDAGVRLVAAHVAVARLDHVAARRLLRGLPRGNARAELLAGRVALAESDPGAARRHFSRLVRLAPEAAIAHLELAMALEREGQPTQALRHYERATEVDRDDARAWRGAGRLRHGLGLLEPAHAAFSEAIRARPQHPDGYLGRGMVAMDMRRGDAAQVDLRMAARLAPDEAAPMMALGDLYRAAHELPLAAAAYQDALRREANNAIAWLKLGNIRVAQDDMMAAVAAFDASIAQDDALAASHNGRGVALMYSGDAEAAAAAFERAAELSPRDPNPMLNIGILAERRGDTRAARDAYQAALDRDPHSEDALRRIARL